MRKNKNLKTGMARIGALMVAALLILESFAISLADGSADASEAITNAAGEGFLSSSLDGILKYLRLRDPDPVQNDLSSQIDGDDRSSALPAEDASNNLAESLPDEIDSETADNGLFDFRI